MAAGAEEIPDVYADAVAYFSQNTPPEWLGQVIAGVVEFATFNANESRRVVVVTSGGTTVPLEKNTVRFIDNFSTGSRGSCSAEEFLDAGYAVIFAHRKGSLMPFTQQWTRDAMMDALVSGDDATVAAIRAAGEKRQAAIAEHRLLFTSFTSVDDYLWLLRALGQTLNECLGPAVMFYLAAAVSDFFVPPEMLPEHKIQSGAAEGNRGGTGLTLELSGVPKTLRIFREVWSPLSFVVSFKLETDQNILHYKATKAIHKYAVDAVVGNILATRKSQVIVYQNTFVEGADATTPHVDAYVAPTVLQKGDARIEEDIIALLDGLHHAHLEGVLQEAGDVDDVLSMAIDEPAPAPV